MLKSRDIHFAFFLLQKLEIFNTSRNADKNYVFINLSYFIDIYCEFKGCFRHHSCNFDNVNKICYSRPT